MRHIKLEESSVMQEFERIASEKGWITNKREAQDAPWDVLPQSKEPAPQSDVQRPWDAPVIPQQAPAAVKTVKPLHFSSPMVKPAQEALVQLMGVEPTRVGRMGPDGQFGPATAGLWNEFAQAYPFLGLQAINPKNPQLPSEDELRKVIGISKMTPQDRASTLAGPPVLPNPKAAVIVNELIALANDLDEMGELKIAEAIDNELKMFKAAADKCYDITGETGEQLIGTAHPGGGPTMVPAKEEGGKVETVVEQQKRDMKVIDSKPTGKYAAFVAKQLVALANRLDAEGKTEAALLVDKTLADLREGPTRPFVVKEADSKALIGPAAAGAKGVSLLGWPALLYAAAAAAIAVGGYEVYKQYSTMEDVLTRLNDLINFMNEDVKNSSGVQVEASEVIDILSKDRDYLAQASNRLQAASDKNSMEEAAKAKAYALYSLASDAKTITDKLNHIAEKLTGWHGFSKTRSNMIGYADRVFAALDRVVKKEIQQANEILARQKEQTGKTPEPQASKKEQETKTSTLSVEVQRLQGTIKKILAIFYSEQNGPNRDKLFKALGGMDRALGLKQALEKMLLNISKFNEVQAGKYNNFVWNNIYTPLQKAGLILHASLEHNLTRQAQDVPSELSGFFGKPKPGIKPRPTGPSRKSRPDIIQFQQAMSQLPGLPPGAPGRVDGVWGKHTRDAWETLRSWTGNKMPAQAPPATDPNGPLPSEVAKALRLAQWFASRLQGHTIPIAGVELPVGAFQDVASFLRGLEKVNKIQKDTSGHLDVAANRAVAAKILREFTDTAEDTPDLVVRFGETGAKELVQRAQGLLSELERPSGIPSYRMPSGEQSQFGQQGVGQRGGKEVEELGALEGPSGKGLRTAPPMSLKAQVYNIPDVSGFVNDPMQFATWAKRYWMRINENEARTGDYYVIAHKVLAYLREQIANLQNTLMTSPDPSRDDLLTTLRQRHEAVNDVYGVLPKG